MVGRIIYKNFETGSYDKMRLTVFGGNSYSDMEANDDFTSYIVTFHKKKIETDFVSSDYAPLCTARQILAIAEKARGFLFDNEYVTIAEFAGDAEDIKIRKASAKSGAFSPVNFRHVFDTNVSDVYKLIGEFPDRTHLYLSLLKDILNYCISETFGIEEEMFGISSVGIYANVSLLKFSRSAMIRAQIPREMCKIMKTPRKRRHMIKPGRYKENAGTFEKSHYTLSGERIIYNYRFLKHKALGCVLSVLPKGKRGANIADFILSLPQNETIISLCGDFYEELWEFAGKFVFLLEAKSHLDYLEAGDVLSLASGVRTEEISKRAAALSANIKLRIKLPCPAYYDSYGRAYWQKGKDI